MYKKPIRDVAQLNQRLVEVWVDFERTIIVDRIMDQWRKRLRAFDPHFEHLL